MQSVSAAAKSLITKILMPEGKRLTADEIFQDPWILKEASQKPLKLSFSRMLNFSKFSKVSLTKCR